MVPLADRVFVTTEPVAVISKPLIFPEAEMEFATVDPEIDKSIVLMEFALISVKDVLPEIDKSTALIVPLAEISLKIVLPVAEIFTAST
jgi:hypothetical protein